MILLLINQTKSIHKLGKVMLKIQHKYTISLIMITKTHFIHEIKQLQLNIAF